MKNRNILILMTAVLLLVMLISTGCDIEDPDPEVHGLVVSVEVPEEIEDADKTLEGLINFDQLSVVLIKDSEELETNTSPVDQGEIELGFEEVEAGKVYELEAEMTGSIRDKTEVNVLYTGEKITPEIEANTVTEVELELLPLSAESVEVILTGDIEYVKEITLVDGAGENEETITDIVDGAVFSSEELDFDLTPYIWGLILGIEGHEDETVEIILLPTEDKEVIVNIEAEDGDIDVELVVADSPEAPQGLEIDDAGNLVWNKVQGAELYSIYSTENEDPEYLGFPINTVGETRYTEPEDGVYYWVRAYTDGLSGAVSEPLLADIPFPDYPSEALKLLADPPGTNEVNLGDKGLKEGDNIIPYLQEWVKEGNQVRIPGGTYTLPEQIILNTGNASVIGEGEVILDRGHENTSHMAIRPVDDFVMTNITLKGVAGPYRGDSNGIGVWTTNPDTKIVLQNIDITDGSVEGGSTGMFVHRVHAGKVYLLDVNIAGHGDNGLYASAPGLEAQGEVHVFGGVYKNNNISNIRLGSNNSSARNAVSIQDEIAPGYIGGARNQRGIWVNAPGDNIVIENCDIIQTVGWNPIILRDGSGALNNIRIYTESDSDAVVVHSGTDWAGSDIHLTGSGNYSLSGPHSFTDIFEGEEAEKPALTP